ncbi:hypothetical protein NE235_26125 [Actinoallomurus spadix]|uniref:Uncharacterized protein n=1 Tax=Actinoallomurus spadix TaxID=79912 RepID=A0ABN0WXN6_9ACTN|nr:hypothetical protein [Actinoallomurus spadix]MCO5989592.1 hypothetical protein [Actinoallomurus spadix]
MRIGVPGDRLLQLPISLAFEPPQAFFPGPAVPVVRGDLVLALHFDSGEQRILFVALVELRGQQPGGHADQRTAALPRRRGPSRSADRT